MTRILFNEAKRFVNPAQSDFLPAAIHLSAILTPKLLISLNLSPSVTILDRLLMSGCSNTPSFLGFLPSLTPFHGLTLTRAACWQTDPHMRDGRYPVNEYGWSCPSATLGRWTDWVVMGAQREAETAEQRSIWTIIFFQQTRGGGGGGGILALSEHEESDCQN